MTFYIILKLLLSLSLMGTVLARKDCVQTDIITTTGVGRRSVKTTIAVLRMGVEENGETARMVQDNLARNAARLVRFLRKQKVQRLQTRGVSLFATFDYRRSPPRPTGFRGSNVVSFEIPISRAGVVLDGAVRNGAKRINRISFRAPSPVIQRARKSALVDAVRTSRSEAHAVASATGTTLGRAINIRITDSFSPRPIMARTNVLTRRSGAQRSPVIGGDQTVDARVTIIYDSY